MRTLIAILILALFVPCILGSESESPPVAYSDDPPVAQASPSPTLAQPPALQAATNCACIAAYGFCPCLEAYKKSLAAAVPRMVCENGVCSIKGTNGFVQMPMSTNQFAGATYYTYSQPMMMYGDDGGGGQQMMMASPQRVGLFGRLRAARSGSGGGCCGK